MKVLFLGEFSGLYKYIVEGLKDKCDVDWYADGDHWKKIGGMTGRLNGNTGVKVFDKIIYPFFRVLGLRGYDVVQIVCPIIFSPRINSFLLKILKRNNGIMVLTAAGSDYAFYRHCRDGKFALPYTPLDECKHLDIIYGEGARDQQENLKVFELVDYIIPCSYDYAEAHRSNPKRLKSIPMAVNTRTVKYTPNVVKDKIVIFHGISREDFKGTKFIRAAMEKIQKNYPDRVEIHMVSHLPFNEYMDLMTRTNIVIDQCRTYSNGINAIIAMAMGKVVLGGNEDITHEEFDGENSAIINIIPDEDQIYAILEELVLNPDRIPIIGEQSRLFAEHIHDSDVVAKQYVEEWRKVL